jgi:hypothetical protein
MEKLLSKAQMQRMNIIGVKVAPITKKVDQTLGQAEVKTIYRTTYLKLCWMCGQPYESNKYNTAACSSRCAHNIWYARKSGFNPPARMEQLVKEKNVKEIKQKYDYY